MTKVSVIVPIYNAGSKLEKCIKSIINQSFSDIEIILVNDGSTDSSLEICKKYQALDNRIVIVDKVNEGSILTRRIGVQKADSEYVMFVDADDWIDFETVKILYQECINYSADITVCNLYNVLGNGRLIKKKNKSKYFKQNKLYVEDDIKNQLVVAYLWGHPFPPSLVAKLYKKDLLLESGKYLKRIKFLGEDLYYNLEMLLKAKRVRVIDKPLYYYRIGGYTSKYMPYLFEDIVNGYLIQKEVIKEFYKESQSYQIEGISIMLLNTFKTCLYNLFNGNLSNKEIRESIFGYLENVTLMEVINNDGSIRYFENDYLSAIGQKDVDYLFNLGKQIYLRKKPRKLLVKIASQII